MTRIIFVGLWLSFLATPADAQSTRTLIEQALDESTKISLQNIKLGDAISKLTEQTGVNIVMPDAAMNLVPHGSDTLITEVILENLPLRNALHRLFDPLGMSFFVRDNHIEIVPKPALRNLGRPPHWQELDTLALLGQMHPGVDTEARNDLAPLLQFQVPIRNGWQVLSQALTHVGAGPGDEVLTIACKNLGWSWSLSRDRIVVVPMQAQIRKRLERPISLRLNNRSLHEMMQSVAKAADVRITTESGALATLPIETQRNFSLTAHNQPAEEVLDSIAAYTGLGYVIEPDGVLFYAPSVVDSRQASVPQRPSPDLNDPIVARITVPLENGQTAEWLIRASELPPDLKFKRSADLDKFFDSLRKEGNQPKPQR